MYNIRMSLFSFIWPKIAAFLFSSVKYYTCNDASMAKSNTWVYTFIYQDPIISVSPLKESLVWRQLYDIFSVSAQYTQIYEYQKQHSRLTWWAQYYTQYSKIFKKQEQCVCVYVYTMKKSFTLEGIYTIHPTLEACIFAHDMYSYRTSELN